MNNQYYFKTKIKMNAIKNFDKVIISFSRPEDENKGYEFIKNPNNMLDGGLNKEITIVIEETSLEDLIKRFTSVAKLTSMIGLEAELLIAAVITAALDLISIKSFPDEYKPLLELLKVTPRGTKLNEEKINNLLHENPELSSVIDGLIEEGFLTRKRSGNLIAKKRILMKAHVDFC